MNIIRVPITFVRVIQVLCNGEKVALSNWSDDHKNTAIDLRDTRMAHPGVELTMEYSADPDVLNHLNNVYGTRTKKTRVTRAKIASGQFDY